MRLRDSVQPVGSPDRPPLPRASDPHIVDGAVSAHVEPIELTAVVARNRLCERAMAHTELRMTPVQTASLLDSAFRHPRPLDFLDAVVMTLQMVGRTVDSTTVAWIGCLLVQDELEILMGLRAAWRRGEDRSPAEAARSTIMAEA